MVEKPFKETRHKLTIEKWIICNRDIVVHLQTLRKDILKSVHDDVHFGVTTTLWRLKLLTSWPRYSKEVDYNKGGTKCAEI